MKIKPPGLLYLVLATALYAAIPKIHSPGAAQDYRDAPRSVNTTALDPNLQKVAILGPTDDRKAPADSTELKRNLARSTVAIMRKSDLSFNGKVYTASAPTLQKGFALDKTVRFAKEPRMSIGSGALVGDNLILTAGHIFYPFKTKDKVQKTSKYIPETGEYIPIIQYTYKRKCEDFYYIFDYISTDTTLSFPPENVYECAAVVAQKVQDADLNNFYCVGSTCSHQIGSMYGPDYAVIQLSTKARNRYPLPISRTAIKIGETIFTIGHPAGLPTKITDNGIVKIVFGAGYFQNDLDIFGGNSGSPVFSNTTLLISGIVIRSPEDYDNGIEAHYTDAYAEATLSTEFEQWIPVTETEKAINAILERKSKRQFEKDGNGYKIVPAISFPGSDVTPVPAVFHPKPAPAVQPKNGI